MYFKGNEWSSKTFTYIGANNSYPTSSVLNQVVTLSMCAPFFWAYDPHNMNTSPFLFLLSHEMTASVNFSQPLSLWEFACPALTVRQAFSSNTPTTGRGHSAVQYRHRSHQQNSTGYIHFAVHEYAESVLWLILSTIMNGRLQVFRFVNCRHYYDLVVNQIKFMKRKNIGQIDCLILISNSLNVLSTSKPTIPTP